MIKIVIASYDHVMPIVWNIREADRVELMAMACMGAEECLLMGLERSEWAFTAMEGDEPLCMFGVVRGDVLDGCGYPWMIGTNDLDRHAVSMIKLNRPFITEMKKQFGYLMNYVDARNKRAIRWLKFLGFTICPATPCGSFGQMFHKFEMR